MTAFDALGYAGTILYLANHAYVSLHPSYRENWYFSANLIAALAVVASSLALMSMQAVATNAFWAIISILRLFGKTPTLAISVPTLGWQTLLATGVCLIIGWWLDAAIAIAVAAWCSVLLFATAYFLFASGQLAKRHYLIANFVAAIVIMPQLWVDANYPVLLLEFAWAVISAVGAVRADRAARVVE